MWHWLCFCFNKKEIIDMDVLVQNIFRETKDLEVQMNPMHSTSDTSGTEIIIGLH